MVIETRPSQCSRRGFTLIELLVGGALGLLVAAAVVFSFMFSSKAVVLATNYATLDQKSETALNNLTRDLRGMNRVTSYVLTPNTNPKYSDAYQVVTQITLAPRPGGSSNEWLQLEYSPSTRCLFRRSGSNFRVLLTGCDFLEFNFFQRLQTNGIFTVAATTNGSLAKLIRVRWACSLSGGATSQQTERAQSAEIALRTK